MHQGSLQNGSSHGWKACCRSCPSRSLPNHAGTAISRDSPLGVAASYHPKELLLLCRGRQQSHRLPRVFPFLPHQPHRQTPATRHHVPPSSPSNIVREDYETLETAVQKAEAEIRKHIRIEQQLKIYLDSLEEKVEELEEKLENEEAKYGQLFEVCPF